MQFSVNTNSQKCTIEIQIRTFKPETICIVIYDAAKKGMKYIDRYKTINGEETIYCRMPVSPSIATVVVYNKNSGNISYDTTFQARYRKIDLICKGIVLGNETKSFLRAISWFAQNARVYDYEIGMRVMTEDGLFCFEYIKKIIKKDANGRSYAAVTPAMIGKQSEIITWAYESIKDMTVPAIILIGLHERYHPIYKDDEEKCDIAALKVCLSLGFPKTSLYEAVCKIFIVANSDENEKRYLKIKNYIENFNYNKYYYEN